MKSISKSGGIVMKKLFALLLCFALALGTAGCGNAPTEPDTQPATFDGTVVISSPTEPYQPQDIVQPMHAIVMPTVTGSTTAADGTVVFTRSYQQIQLILNGTDIEPLIANDLGQRISEALNGSAEMEQDALDSYSADPEYWTAHFIDISYTPTRLDQSVLSLFGNHSSYSGGIHPSLVTESVTYDLSTGSALTLGDILVEDYSGEALSSLIIAALADRAGELCYDYEAILQDRFSRNYGSNTSWYFSRTGLCFHFSPYDIAPYSSGTIIAEIPYESLNGVLKEQYLPAAQLNATGSVYAEMYIEDDAERFSFMAEVTLDDSGTQILLYPDAAVTDVSIESGTWYSDGSQYIPVSTVFAADSVGLGNAILITADLSADAPVLRLNYRSGGQEVSAFIMYDEAGDSVILAHG